MKQVLDLIAAGRDEEALAAWNAETIEIRDSTKRDRDWLVATIGETEAAKILRTLENSENPLVRAEYVAVNSAGVDLSTNLRQQLIEAVGNAAGWSADTIAKLKSAGVKYTSLAMQDLGRPATQADIDAIRDRQRVEAIDALRAHIENTWIHPERQRGGKTVDEIKAAILQGLSG